MQVSVSEHRNDKQMQVRVRVKQTKDKSGWMRKVYCLRKGE